MARGLEARILKLEARRRPPTGLFFLAWGRSESEARAVVDQLKADGALHNNDIVVAGTWSRGEPMPASRWVGKGGLSRLEDDVLSEEVDRAFGHLLKRETKLSSEDQDQDMLRYRDLLRSLSDEELIAEIWRGATQGLLIEKN
jgi:hypothetical protein